MPERPHICVFCGSSFGMSPAFRENAVRVGAEIARRGLGLVYGAIDLRRTPDNEYYFFEVNTAGEFLFIEDRTGLPIASAIADWLAERALSLPDAVPRASARRRAMPMDTIAS